MLSRRTPTSSSRTLARSISRSGPLIARAGYQVGRAAGAAYKRYRSGWTNDRSNKRQKTSGVSNVTTYQHDVKRTYKKRRPNKKYARKAKRFRKAYLSQTLRNLQSRKYHYNGSMNWQSAAGTQQMFGWFNYGAFGVGGVDGSGDMQDLLLRLLTETGAGGDKTQQDMGTNGAQGKRFYFDNMSCRCVLTNVGTSTVFWEVYECVARKDLPLNGRTTTGLQFTLEQYLTTVAGNAFQASLPLADGGGPQSATQTTAVTAPLIQSSGVTPFQFRRFCQDFKIMKCTKLQCSPGNTVSFNANNPKNLTVIYDDWKDLAAKRGLTKLYLVRQWGAVNDGTVLNSASNVACEVEKDYNVKVWDSHPPELNYIKYTNNVET